MLKNFWCAVASHNHIQLGLKEGFCQICHGKAAPLNKMKVGDGIVYYSPVIEFGKKDKCQRFTAIGKVIGEHSYQVEMSPGFTPYRKNIKYFTAQEVDIHPLLKQLEFTAGKTNWGYKFRFGHFALSEKDFQLILSLMVGNNCFNKEFI